jgi:signal transduction histidine kinase
MSGQFYLDWAVMAVSLFNTILLFWLGLTVLLNAEDRTWAIWLAGAGPLMGGVFFFVHSANLIQGLAYVSWGMDFWWHVGWIPIIALPLAWYAMMLWYAGFWQQQRLLRYGRHRVGLFTTALLAVGLGSLFLFSIPLPSFWQVTQFDLSATPSIGGVSILIAVYPIYILLCISLSLDALRRPQPSRRLMAELARRRARPWLVAASIALLLASLLVSGVVLWTIYNARAYLPGGLFAALSPAIAWFDLAISALIGASILSLGTAVVSYEVFTGKTLPRGGLRRYWRNSVLLAASYALALGWSLSYRFHALYSLLLSILLIILFFALLSWRSFAERERYIQHLRPFVASPRLYEHVVTPASSSQVDVRTPFHALCRDVLGVETAYLGSVGPLTPLVGPPLTFPDGTPESFPSITELVGELESPETICIPLEPTRFGGALWAIPLWSERGLIGVLILGRKRDGGIYTQEEIEIARASGERLIDTQASAEMARRLMALQRQRLAESQILDRQTRRTLHDDVLPQLHAAMLTLHDTPQDTLGLLADAHRRISDLLHEMPATTPAVSRLGLVRALQRTVESELGTAFDRVDWDVEPAAEREAQRLPSLTAEVIFYAAREAMRNAARHGRPDDTARPLQLKVALKWQEGLDVLIEDDGVGLQTSGTSGDGSGQGLALHSTMMAVVGGSLAIESERGTYTRVTLALPAHSYQPTVIDDPSGRPPTAVP